MKHNSRSFTSVFVINRGSGHSEGFASLCSSSITTTLPCEENTIIIYSCYMKNVQSDLFNHSVSLRISHAHFSTSHILHFLAPLSEETTCTVSQFAYLCTCVLAILSA